MYLRENRTRTCIGVCVCVRDSRRALGADGGWKTGEAGGDWDWLGDARVTRAKALINSVAADRAAQRCA